MLLALSLVAACTSSRGDEAGTAQLGVDFDRSRPILVPPTDDTPDLAVAKVVIFVDTVSVHSNSAGWIDVRSEPFDLELTGSSREPMTMLTTAIPAGDLTEIRLVTRDAGGYVVTADGATHPLKVPSGAQTGIKIQGLWPVEECQILRLRLDFDASTSMQLHATGNDAEWILNPVLRVSREDRDKILGCEPFVVRPLPGRQ